MGRVAVRDWLHGDAEFANLKVSVTNAENSIAGQTLALLIATSINLTADVGTTHPRFRSRKVADRCEGIGAG